MIKNYQDLFGSNTSETEAVVVKLDKWKIGIQNGVGDLLNPEDGPLPGTEDQVIHDCQLDRKDLSDETAGFTDPTNYLKSENDSLVIFLEKTRADIYNPGCVNSSGRSFTASALKKSLKPQTSGVCEALLRSHLTFASL